MKTTAADESALLGLFDDTVKTKPFAQTSAKDGRLASRSMTERELLDEALRTRPGLTAERLIRDGALSLAREIVRKSKLKTPFRPGAADGRIAKAYKTILAENKKRERDGKRLRRVTYTTLALEAKTKPQTALAWLTRVHPELLTP